MLFENNINVPAYASIINYPKAQRATREDIKPSRRVDGYLIATCLTNIQGDLPAPSQT